MTWRGDANLAWLRSLAGVEESKSLARHTSFNIGGPADFLVESADPGPLLREARRRRIPTRVIGAGTNLLVADAGVEGLVVRVVTREHHVEGTKLRAAAGLKMMRLARIAADSGLRGFEFAIGVPGTVGGAVYQNAGCWGKELREVEFPPASSLAVLIRDEHAIPARPETRLRTGDKILAITSAEREGELRNLLMDQRFIGGIGNAYADEILWDARLHPKRRIGSLTADELARLHGSVRDVIAAAVAEVERAMPPALGTKPRDHLRIRGRAGGPCPRCGATIKRVRSGLGEVDLCPGCQPAPKGQLY